MRSKTRHYWALALGLGFRVSSLMNSFRFIVLGWEKCKKMPQLSARVGGFTLGEEESWAWKYHWDLG